MRIRKNAKNSTLLNPNANVLKEGDECLLQKNLLCQLNQSPWDIITFPSSDSSSSLHQLDDNECYYHVSLAGNGISNDSSGDFDSVSVPSVKNVFEGEYYDLVEPKNEYDEPLRFEGVVTKEFRVEIMLCDKRDKKGWQCGKVVKNGETVCDRHHILELQNHASSTTKKMAKPMTGSLQARSRTKKKVSTNPYEFYYYSGFGPSWGKKRGTVSSTGSNTYNDPTKVVSDGDYKIMETSLTKDEMDVQNDEGHTKMELAFMDDDNKKRKTGNITGKKRGRKPMKARSLKSLM